MDEIYGGIKIMNLEAEKSSITITAKKKKNGFLFYAKRDFWLYFLVALPMIYFIIFKYIPMYGITIAFKDYNLFKGVSGSPWIGLKAFKEIFAMPDFYKIVRNTFLLNFLDLLFGFPAPIILAILLNEIRVDWFKRVSQTVLYLPHFLSWVIIGGMVLQVFGPKLGLINVIRTSLGSTEIPFLTENWHWIFTYVGVGVWQSVGWGTIIFLAAITGINSELYEAAEVDGASRLRRIWHITLPGIKPTIIILLILNVGKIASIGFERPFIIGNQMVKDYSDVISTFVYRIGLQASNFTNATAVGLFQSVIGMIFLLTTNYIANKSGEQGIW